MAKIDKKMATIIKIFDKSPHTARLKSYKALCENINKLNEVKTHMENKFKNDGCFIELL